MTECESNLYFSEQFGIDPNVLEEYGAFDVSIVSDLPLFSTRSCSSIATNPSTRRFTDRSCVISTSSVTRQCPT